MSTQVRVHLQIDGVLSVHAVRALELALGSVTGILAVEASLATVAVLHDGSVTTAQLADAVTLAGCVLVSSRTERGVLPIVSPSVSPSAN